MPRRWLRSRLSEGTLDALGITAGIVIGTAGVIAALLFAAAVVTQPTTAWDTWVHIAGFIALGVVPIFLLWGWCKLIDAIAAKLTPKPHTCRRFGYDLLGLGPVTNCP